jgi:glycine C-acetyltransferase
MEGDIANLPELVKLCEKHEAILIVDDSHGVGVMGPNGRGTAEHFGLEDKVDILTGTLGKALGGAAGGYVAANKDVTDMLIQASRPHIFSNSISPTTAAGALAAIELMEAEPQRVTSLHEKVAYFRKGLKDLGFNPLDGESAIIPIIVGETAFAIKIAAKMLEKGIYVTGFGFPVVPEGVARVRVQISDALTKADMDTALKAFAEVGTEVGLLKKSA